MVKTRCLPGAMLGSTLAAWLCGIAFCSAFPKSHGPFAPGTEPGQVPLQECVQVKGVRLGEKAQNAAGTKWFVVSGQELAPVVKLQRREAGWEINVIDEQQRPLLAVPATNDVPGFLGQVYSAELNRDGLPDFIVNIWSGGCGLAAEGSQVTFLLSDGKGYKAQSFFSYYFGGEDVVALRAGGPCYFIHSDMTGNGEEKTRDGRDHNFWVYQLYRIEGGRLIQANGDHREFPKWVWYTLKANHKETYLLTEEQKHRLRRRW